MYFTENEKFLIILCVILAAVIGALLHTLYLYRKDIKLMSKDYKNTMSFIDKVLNNIAIRENIDIKKYIDMTHQQVNETQKGGKDNG